MKKSIFFCFFLFLIAYVADAFVPACGTSTFKKAFPFRRPKSALVVMNMERSKMISPILAIGLAFSVGIFPATAGIDVNQIETIKKLQEAQAALDAADIEFTKLPSGVSYREFRAGKGQKTVEPGSIVSAEMTIRCKSLSTAKEPGGVKYYDTKIDTPLNYVAWEVGSGEYLPGLEEAMIGMKKNAIRRIEIPSQLIFKARNDKQLPLPSSANEDGQRRFKNIFKTDATMIFEVLVTKISGKE
jgi:hypothetical protein